MESKDLSLHKNKYAFRAPSMTHMFVVASLSVAVWSIASTHDLHAQVKTTSHTEFCLEQLPVGLIPAGTVVNAKPPTGWSNIIIKSFPAADRGDHEKIGSMDRRLATMFKTITLANVESRQTSQGKRFQLANVAIGVAVPIGEQGDTIITPKSQKKLGANLGWMGQLVLNRLSAEFKKIHFVSRNDNAVIYDTPVILNYKGRNKEMFVRYFILVDQMSGQLTTFLWAIDADNGQYKSTASKVHLLPENLLSNCHLVVDKSKYTIGIPSNTAFGCESLPKAKTKFEAPGTLKEFCHNKTLSAKQSEQLVESFQKLAAHFNAKK